MRCTRWNTNSPAKWGKSKWTWLWLVGALLIPLAGHGSFPGVEALFSQTRYDESANEFHAGGSSDARPGEDILWQIRLSNDPDEVVELCTSALRFRGLSEAVRCQFTLQLASVESSRNRYSEALFPLRAIINDHKEPLPGQIHLLAGICYRALGQKQRSREMFASVRAQDPAFPWARYYLGQMGVESGDLPLALRYFESADQSTLATRTPILLAGIWEALRMDDLPMEASATWDNLLAKHPNSLAAMQVQDISRREAQEQAILLAAGADSVTTPVGPTDHSGRVSLQLGAFRDRSLALIFISEWENELPDLRIDAELDKQEQIFYKVRTGRFVSRAQAYTEQQRLQRNHNLESIPVESPQ